MVKTTTYDEIHHMKIRTPPARLAPPPATFFFQSLIFTLSYTISENLKYCTEMKSTYLYAFFLTSLHQKQLQMSKIKQKCIFYHTGGDINYMYLISIT